MIVFTRHAREKFAVLKMHGFVVSEKKVLETLEKPDLVDFSRLPLLIAQRKFDRNRVLRVVYKEERGVVKIITFYPGRVRNYVKRQYKK